MDANKLGWWLAERQCQSGGLNGLVLYVSVSPLKFLVLMERYLFCHYEFSGDREKFTRLLTESAELAPDKVSAHRVLHVKPLPSPFEQRKRNVIF